MLKLCANFLENNSKMCVKFCETTCNFNTQFGEILVVHDVDTYEGEYEVTPRIYNQELETKEKFLNKNVTVYKIPKAAVLNIKNGYTVTIG